MRKGDKGEHVKKVQEALRSLGLLNTPADGVFGAKTQAAVVAFQQAYLVDGIVDQVTADAIDHAVKAWTTTQQTLLMPVPFGLEQIKEVFGFFEYTEADGGYIVPDQEWVAENIVLATLPIVGTHQVHKKMEPIFAAVLQDIKDKGLDSKILTFGVWSPRHKMHDKSRGLSSHAWAISCDINASTNMPGRVGDMDPGIVESFERFGFDWGGRWRQRDDMHFQYARGY